MLAIMPAVSSVPAPAPLSDGVRRSRALAVFCLLALILLGLAWELRLAPTGRGTLWIKVLPLAFAVPGVLRLRLYTYRWLSLLVWLYFTEGVVRALTGTRPASVLALVEVGLSLLLFAACAWHVRSRFAASRMTTIDG